MLQVQTVVTMWALPIALITLLNYTACAMDNDISIKLIFEFITENKLKAAVAMTCWKKTGNCMRGETE
jgi:hypothetical protein